jgi:hypothetical protein
VKKGAVTPFFYNFVKMGKEINRSSSNTFVVTLTEKTTITTPTYLFSFQSDVTNSYKNFIASDISASTDRYNEFIIVEVGNGTEDLYNGEIRLATLGRYTYRIYAQSSTTNLIPADADELVETGILTVNGAEVTYIEPDDNDDNYYINQDE